MGTCYIVLGTPRSGTSCVAGLLNSFGIFMGDQFFEPDEMNPKGYFQDLEFESIFDDIIEFIPNPFFRIPENIVSKVVALVKKRNSSLKEWGAKFKLAAWVLPQIDEECKKSGVVLKIIRTKRNVQSSIDSLAKWSYPHDQHPRESITRAIEAADLALLKVKSQLLIVDFDLLVDNTQSEIAKLSLFIDKIPTDKTLDFVSGELRRF